MNTLSSLAFLLVIIMIQIILARDLDRKRRLNEKWNQKLGRRLFYTFFIIELSSFLLGCFIFFLVIFVHKMPLNWELMHSFGKYHVPLQNPSELSLLLAFWGIPIGILSIIFSFKFNRLLAGLSFIIVNLVQMYFIHWLVD